MRSIDEAGSAGQARTRRGDPRRSAGRPIKVRLAIIVLAGVGVLMSGCGASTFSGTDLRVETTPDTVYLLARNTGVSRNLCAGLGGDMARVQAQSAAMDGRTMSLASVGGCYTVRHIIVCSDGDAKCIAHEERHRSEGAFHP